MGYLDDDLQTFGSFSRDLYNADQLIEAILVEDLRAVRQLLVERKARPNTVVPERGCAAMHLLAGLEDEHFAEEAVVVALTVGGDPNVPSDEGLTPVHVAAMWGRCRVLARLLEAGGLPGLRDHERRMDAEEYAVEHHQWEAYGLLAAHVVFCPDDRSELAPEEKRHPYTSNFKVIQRIEDDAVDLDQDDEYLQAYHSSMERYRDLVEGNGSKETVSKITLSRKRSTINIKSRSRNIICDVEETLLCKMSKVIHSAVRKVRGNERKKSAVGILSLCVD